MITIAEKKKNNYQSNQMSTGQNLGGGQCVPLKESNLRRHPPPLFPNCIFINIFDKRDPIVNCPLHLNCTTAMLHTIDNTALKSPPPQHHHHHPLSTTHARTHARPSLPIVQDPNPTPPNWHPVELHDTAASAFRTVPQVKSAVRQ